MKSEQRKYTVLSLRRYWENNADLINELPLMCHGLPDDKKLYMSGVMINMPHWASDITLDNKLLIPEWAAIQANYHWEFVDWIAVCFWYINNIAERQFENRHGPVHSYSYRLKKWDKRFWEHAWVNRIAIFLRLWCAESMCKHEELVFGSRPRATFVLSHDIDAVAKTFPIRIKQSLFNLFNALRLLARGKITFSMLKFRSAIRFLFSNDNYWCFDKVLDLESRYDQSSVFHVYARSDNESKGFKIKLFDPLYDVCDESVRNIMNLILERGCDIGLHQSFDAWGDYRVMLKQKKYLEENIGRITSACRQHWLRFSFNKTWCAQQMSGFKNDYTLGFNDRPGFRNSAAIKFCPWNEGGPLSLEVTPLMLMDSHLYDYNNISEQERAIQIKKWIGEVKKVGGEVSILWHPHAFSDDYGWAGGYQMILEEIA